MMFCPPNSTLSVIWINDGINPCFFDTVSVNVYTDILIILGLIQWIRYFKSSTPTADQIRPTSFAFFVQITLSILMPLLAIIRFCLQITLIGNKVAYGYMIIYFSWNVVCWPFSLLLIFMERSRKLENDVKSGHCFVLLLFWSLTFVVENLTFVNFKSSDWWFGLKTYSDDVEFSLFVLRYVSTFILFIVGFYAPGIPKEYASINTDNGAQSSSTPTASTSTWKDLWKKMNTLFPFMWPKRNILLQLVVFVSVILLILGRVANVIVPIYYKLIVNSLGGDGNPPQFCWDLILIYVFVKFLQGGGTGGMGLLNNIRTFLWISVQQYTTREIQVQLFAHLHSLSLRWHLGRKTGEVVRVMDRGTNSVNQLLSYIVFNILPTIFDIIIAVVYFSTSFNIWFGLIVLITMILYLAATILVTEWRTKFRRSMNLSENLQKTRGVDSLLNYETVKYYSGEEFEAERYRESIVSYQVEEYKSNASLCFLNTVQNIIINGGLLVGSLLCAWMVSKHTLTVGDYVLFSTYIIQLYTPLNWFGTYYRVIQQSFIDAENMFDLLNEKQEVTDKDDAKMLMLPQGRIEFKDVTFHYQPEKLILKDISFKVEPGKTIAIVGPSGAGKSTIMRLLFRFFDVTGGAILIDGVDIREYTQTSLRKAMGVVPQDTVLFNESIMYNIKYGKVNSVKEEIIMAAQNAEIHQSILSFPAQYESIVGERGLKLSGGEKQRIAIARTILKGPTFILLDEATSALDTQTERNIQSALLRICSGRTVVIVAHRLSTIIHADKILVLSEGRIAERGSHQDLLNEQGLYAKMWQQQLENHENGSGSEKSSDKEDEKIKL